MTKESLRRWWHITHWRLRYLWLDTPFGRWMHIGAAILMLIVAVLRLPAALGAAQSGPVHAEITLFTQIVIMVVMALVSIALTPKQPDAVDQVIEAPRLKDGNGVRMVFGEVWITDPDIIGWKKMGTKTIRGKKSGFNGRPIIGYWYKQLFHFALCRGPVDAVLEFRGGDKTAWTGEMTASADVQINKRDLWGGSGTGGEGGIEGPLEFLFGDSAQTPNSYLASALGAQQPAYRGLLTALFKGGLWGAFSPYPKAASFKVRRILEGWEREDGAWYPERAAVAYRPGGIIDIGPTSDGWRYSIGAGDDSYAAADFDDSAWNSGQMPFASSNSQPFAAEAGYPTQKGANWPINTTLWARREFILGATYGFSLEVFVDNFATVWVNGFLVLPRVGSSADPGAAAFLHEVVVPASVLAVGRNVICIKGEDFGSYCYAAFKLKSVSGAGQSMNPAHMLYQSITDRWMGGEPEAQINDASFRAAADTLHAEGFGLCTEWTSTNESVEAFQQRICNVIGANLSRSPVDGKWYLDLIRGGYDTSTLPVLTDDDILEYAEQPGTLSDAVNQVTVEWRDPVKREDRSTAPVQSLGGIQMAGAVVGQVSTYREIPEETLALRAAARDLQAKARPLRRITGKVTRVGYAWRPGQVIKLQSAKRGIASMFCRVGDIDRGTLRSGAVSLSLLQDVFGLPQAVYVQPEAGSGPGDDDAPKPVAASAVQEVPYALLVALQPPGELAALPADAGFLFAVATPAGAEIDYSLQVDAGVGAGYEQQAESDWSATALTVAAAGRVDTVIGITGASGLEDAVLGAMVLWGSEICRLDAVDLIAGTVTLGRGCADTVPAPHVAGERLWVIDDSIALDVDQYNASDSVSAKLLPRTGGQALSLASAPAVSVTFASRQARPYPPAAVTINGGAYPAEVFTTADVAWRHRDRIASGAGLVDQTAASLGPEAGVTYTVRWFIGGVLDHTEAGITGTTASHVPAADGLLRVEVEAVRDGLTSWQMQVIECDYRVTHYSDYVNEVGDVYADQNGETYLG